MIVEWKDLVLYDLNEGSKISINSAVNVGDEHYDVSVLVSNKTYKYYSVPESTYRVAESLMKKGTGYAGLNLLKRYEVKKDTDVADEKTANEYFTNMKKRFSVDKK